MLIIIIIIISILVNVINNIIFKDENLNLKNITIILMIDILMGIMLGTLLYICLF